jgi:hypothetical protein
VRPYGAVMDAACRDTDVRVRMAVVDVVSRAIVSLQARDSAVGGFGEGEAKKHAALVASLNHLAHKDHSLKVRTAALKAVAHVAATAHLTPSLFSQILLHRLFTCIFRAI